MALSIREPHFNQEKWLKELEKTSTANKAEDQEQTTSVTHTKLLENGRDSETSTTTQSSTDVDVDDVDFQISSFWLQGAWFQEMSGERRRLNLSNKIPMVPAKSSKERK